jgi:glutaminyl-tRNA synthetase
VNYTITSKRKLKELVEKGFVTGWDDPRMPTITAMRRRGYTAASIRNFIEKAGVSKREQQIEINLLEFCLREDLNKVATRAMCVMQALKVIITNFPEGKTELMQVENNPEMEGSGTHEMPFGRELFIEMDDFMIDPPKKYFRLAPGQMVRLKGAYIIQCDNYLTDSEGNVTEVHCSYIENSRSGNDTSGLKVKGTLHWVSATEAVPVEVRLYDRLFAKPEPGSDGNYLDDLNPKSLEIISKAYAEPFLKKALADDRFQFMRIGYFCLDKDSNDEKLVFNRTVSLKEGF